MMGVLIPRSLVAEDITILCPLPVPAPKQNSEIWGGGHLSPVPRLWGWTILYLLTGRDDMGQNPLIMSCGKEKIKQVSNKENKKTFQ